MLPVKEYTVAKEKYGSFKEKRKKAHDKVQELDARNKPVTEFREYVALVLYISPVYLLLRQEIC